MYEIIATDEFARWFEVLGELDAERVAGALEIVAATGPSVDPARASPWLLWFDATGASPIWNGLGLEIRAHEDPAHAELLRWQREVVRCLEMKTLESALARLESERAARALEAVQEVRELLKAAWLSFTLYSGSMRQHLQGVGSTRAAVGAALVRPSVAIPRVKAAFERAISLLGLELAELGDRESGLRELTLNELDPKLRVIYGIDVPSRCILALVGDALTRQYYGDSVTLAERRWKEHRERRPTARTLRPAP